jgi:DMSO/TMAO reductase YedYZ molybdopterin-dependent catalytic subunit
LAALAALGIPESVWALQEGEELLDFADYTSAFKVDVRRANPHVRHYDLRRLTAWATDRDEFFAFHQTEIPRTDAANWRLRIDGFVDRPGEFSLDDLKLRSEKSEAGVTIECSGNSPHPSQMNGLVSNAVWSGVGLSSILKECGVQPDAREAVFFGKDHKSEKKWQAGNREVSTPHGRSIPIQDALHPKAMLAYEMNGRPLPAAHGFPLRLILPGWYGMTQVKWLTHIHVLDRRYEGEHMARNYHGLRAVHSGPDGTIWLDTSISVNKVKSVIARATRRSTSGRYEYKISGAAWGGRTPIAKVEVQVDEGEWQPALIDDRREPDAWILWSAVLKELGSGKHMLVSRAIAENGEIQPTLKELREKLGSGRENNAQWPRILIL